MTWAQTHRESGHRQATALSGGGEDWHRVLSLKTKIRLVVLQRGERGAEINETSACHVPLTCQGFPEEAYKPIKRSPTSLE